MATEVHQASHHMVMSSEMNRVIAASPHDKVVHTTRHATQLQRSWTICGSRTCQPLETSVVTPFPVSGAQPVPNASLDSEALMIQYPTMTTNDYNSAPLIEPFITNVITGHVPQSHCNGHNLNDYEDMWTASCPAQRFRPIERAASEEESATRALGHQAEARMRFSAVDADRDAGKMPQPETSSANGSQLETGIYEGIKSIKKKSNIYCNKVLIEMKQDYPSSVVYTFDLNEGCLLAGTEQQQVKSEHILTQPGLSHTIVSLQQNCLKPSYLTPCDTQIGTEEDPSTLKTKNTVHNENISTQDDIRHTIKLEPIASPRVLEQCHNSCKQHVNHSAIMLNGWDIPEIGQKATTLSRSHETLSPRQAVVGHGDLGPGYSRSLSLPRSFKDLSLSEPRIEQCLHQTEANTDSSVLSPGSESQMEANGSTIDPKSALFSRSFNETFFKEDVVDRLEQCSPSPPVGKFPVYSHMSSRSSVSDDGSTIEDLIADVSPDLTLKPVKPLTIGNVSRMSEYDNVTGVMNGLSSQRTGESSVGTYYCQPWDSTLWDDLLNLGSTAHKARVLPPWMTCDGSAIPSHLNRDSDNISSIGNYSMLGSIADTGSFHMGSVHDDEGSDPCQSEVATSFEWKVNGGAALQRLSITPLCPSLMEDEGEESDKLITMETTSLQDISDDEGVEDVGSGIIKCKLTPFLGTHHLISVRSLGNRNTGIRIKEYIVGLAQDKDTTFGVTVENFIKCTIEGAETNPHIVTRNVRQFMNGMKNYLVHHGEVKLNAVIEQERSKLELDEFLNIDAIIEGSLQKVVIRPLKHHIYSLFVQEYKRNGGLQILSENLRHARTKTPQELGIRDEMVPPLAGVQEGTKMYLHRMQKAYSPLKKLQNLLGATATIYDSVQNQETGSKDTLVSLGADDFLPLFVWVLVQCGVVSAEVEAEYMWGLLHPCLLAGEGGYYLTTLSSAVIALKNLRTAQKAPTRYLEGPSGFIKILIPDEQHDSIITKTLPVRPNMTARDVCGMIAHKFQVTNPQDYGLYVLADGAEERLEETVCPQTVKLEISSGGKQCLFAFKRNHAKFAWPVFNR